MTGIEFVFIFGLIMGFLIGSWVGGRWVLYRMHHDDVQSAHTNYQKRKDRYINKKG